MITTKIDQIFLDALLGVSEMARVVLDVALRGPHVRRLVTEHPLDAVLRHTPSADTCDKCFSPSQNARGLVIGRLPRGVRPSPLLSITDRSSPIACELLHEAALLAPLGNLLRPQKGNFVVS